jgi:hypothetical protein
MTQKTTLETFASALKKNEGYWTYDSEAVALEENGTAKDDTDSDTGDVTIQSVNAG